MKRERFYDLLGGALALVFTAAIVCLLLLADKASAAPYSSSGDGDWSNAATWGGSGPPGIGDSATINTGHTVTVDASVGVGSSPGNTTTYDLLIDGGTLRFENDATDVVLTVYSSVKITGGGDLLIGDKADDYNCSGSGSLVLATAAAGQKYNIWVDDGGLRPYGCTGYPSGGANQLWRSRITACSNTTCDAGAGLTITLADAVDWTASASIIADARMILVGVGGSAADPPAAGDDPEVIASWTRTGTTSQLTGVTFAENHAVGDLVVHLGRNAVIKSDSTSTRGYIYASAVDDPYIMKWGMIKELGDNNTTGSAITFNATANTVGVLDHMSVTGAFDGGVGRCFYLVSSGWTTFTDCACYDTGGSTTSALLLNGTTLTQATPMDLTNFVVMGDQTVGNPDGIIATMDFPINLDGFWCSHCDTAVDPGDTPLFVDNMICQAGINECLYFDTEVLSELRNIPTKVENSEFRNITNNNVAVFVRRMDTYFNANDFDNVEYACIHYSTSSSNFHTRHFSNSFDGCNSDEVANHGAIYFQGYSFDVEQYEDTFGVATANGLANIAWTNPVNSTTGGSTMTGHCSECVLGATSNGAACVGMPEDGLRLDNCTNYSQVSYLPPNTRWSLHNKDGTEDSHKGWGPGGMIFQRQTGTVYTTSNLKLQITPGQASDYNYLLVGKVWANEGDTVTVNLYLRKDTAMATAGTRPRLALEGVGFDRLVDYDEMSDVTNTWELVTVTGTAAYKGAAKIYVGVKNTLNGDDYTPTWPPTLDVYADGLSATAE